jgi:isopenicillin N synthase-like dioxygenase
MRNVWLLLHCRPRNRPTNRYGGLGCGSTILRPSVEEKNQVRFPSEGYPYGYAGFAQEGLSYSLGQTSHPDLKETITIGPVDLPDRSLSDGERWAFSPSLWPQRPDGIRNAWETYYRSMGDLSARLLSLFAETLGLAADHFDDSISAHSSALRFLNYPEQLTNPLPGQLRAGAHTDYGTLTILRQQSFVGGLEVFEAGRDRWIPVAAVEGAYVVNLGDAMARWTNDRWRSTLHRVVNPPAGDRTTRRQSIAFFHNANWNAEIRCLPTCLLPGEKPKYEPILAGPHLMKKFQVTQLNT